MPSMSFLINDQSTSSGGAPTVKVTVTENADGTLTFKIEQLVAAGNYLGDLRGLFFDLANEGLLGSLQVTSATRYLANGGTTLTASSAGPIVFASGNDTVSSVGSSSNNMNGLLGSDGGFDAAVEIGSEGVGAGGDDVRAFSFTLDSTARDLTLADLANVNFGVRIMSVGRDTNGDGVIDTARDGSSKLLENAGVVAIADVDSVTEDGPTQADGNVLTGSGGTDANATDGKADLGATGTTVIGVAKGAMASASSGVGSAVAGTYGSIKIASNGAYTYTLDNSAVQSLAAGETTTETFTYTIKSADGDTSSTTILITINGTNDRPDIKLSMGDSGTAGLTETNAGLSTSGKLTVLDVDTSDTVSVAVSSVATSGSGGTNGIIVDALKAMLSLTGNTGNAADGTAGSLGWKFDSGSQAFDYLGKGETLVLTYTLTGTDTQGASDAQTVTITITGTNDGPVAVADVASGTENQTLTVNVLANDTDLDDGHSFTLTNVAAPNGQGSASIVSNQLVFNPGTDFDHLAAGDTATVVVSYSMKDDQGATSTSDVTITITGTNDGPVAVADVASGTENQTLTVNVLANDTDLDDGHSFTLTNVAAPNGQGSASIVSNQLVFNPGTDFDHLAAGDTATVVVSYSMKDDQGATSTSDVTITITGTNDVVTVIAAGTTASGAVVEDTTSVASGTITFIDVDLKDGHTASVAPAPANTTGLGSLVLGAVNEAAGAAGGTVGWAYTINDAAAQFLAAGEVVTETYVVTLDDGHGSTTTQNVTVRITGTNDVAVIGNPTVASVTEDVAATNGNLVANGSISISDADHDQSSFTTTVTGTQGNLGTLTLAANGSYTYSVANSVTQYLQANETKVDTFTVTALDGTTKQVSFTINGANDSAVIGNPTVASVTEDVAVTNGNLVANGSISISDADHDQSSFKTTVTGTQGNLGTLTLAANGSYTYSVANSVTQYLQANETKVDTFTVTALDGTTKQVSFTINGANEVNSAVNDKLIVSTNTIATFSTSVLTSNDLNQLAVIAMAINGTSPNGTLAFDKLTQTFTYSSTSGTGAAVDTLTYTLSNGSTGTVTLDVVNANPGFDLKTYLGSGSYQGAFLDAAGGPDTLTGASASDTLIGGDGNDTLIGDAGSDILRGGAGNDTLDGQGATRDFDLIDFSDGNAGINFTLTQSASVTTFTASAASGLGTDNYRNMEGVIGTNFADTLNGSNFADIIKGGGGNDIINGNDGDDFIYGGAGDDGLNGGLGKDTFVYEGSGLGTDTITGFVSGTDKIDLKAYGISIADVQSTFANNALTLSVDTDHNGTSDLIIKLNAMSSVSASDFIF